MDILLSLPPEPQKDVRPFRLSLFDTGTENQKKHGKGGEEGGGDSRGESLEWSLLLLLFCIMPF